MDVHSSITQLPCYATSPQITSRSAALAPMPRPMPAGAGAAPVLVLPAAPVAPRTGHTRPKVAAAAIGWLCLSAIYTLAGVGLVSALRSLFFGQAGTDCTGAVLTSCEDSPEWRWNTQTGAVGCPSFAQTVARNETSLHGICATAKSVTGEIAAEACKTACATCGLSRGIEFVVASAPILARNALIGALLIAGCSKVSGIKRRTGLLEPCLLESQTPAPQRRPRQAGSLSPAREAPSLVSSLRRPGPRYARRVRLRSGRLCLPRSRS